MFDLALLTPPDGFDKRRQAKFLYWMGWAVTDIAGFQGEKVPTVHSWKQRDEWDSATALHRMEGVLEARFAQLVLKPVKTGSDFKEIDLLGRQAERLAKIRRYEAPGGHSGDLNDKVQDRNERGAAAGASKRKAAKNHFDDEAIEALREAFHKGLYEYQEHWWSEREQRDVIGDLLVDRHADAGMAPFDAVVAEAAAVGPQVGAVVARQVVEAPGRVGLADDVGLARRA